MNGYRKTTKVTKSGNSLCVVIPAALVRVMGIKSGDTAKVVYDMNTGKATYTFVNMRQLTLV